jgi:predicted Zn-dependent protease
MKKFFKIVVPIFLLVIFGAIVYKFRPQLLSLEKNALPVLNQVGNQIKHQVNNQLVSHGFTAAPCSQPITYATGSIDTRFGISQKYLLSALTDAEAIWEKPSGKNLFQYAPDGDVKVNLIYDSRQQATDKLASLGIVVSDNRASYDALKTKFTGLNAKLAAAKSDYDASVQSYNNNQKAYETEVQFWNAQGGAPTAEFDKLQAEKTQLDAQLSQLQAMQAQFNKMVDEINALVIVLNGLVKTLNISVDNYNTVGGSRGQSFEEGVYQSDGVKAEIDIYEYSSRAKLVRVLAHELGHALGLDHVNDPKSIMYKLNQSTNIILTADDLAALNAKCGVK